MPSRASIFGHPIHPMLVGIPIGLFVFSLIADIAARYGLGEAWPTVAFYCMGGGIIGALIAAVFGLMDWLSMSDGKAKKIGLAHMVINVVVVTLYCINFGLRLQGAPGVGLPFVLSEIGVLLLLVSAWLGGHMVFVHGVAGEPVARPLIERRYSQVPVQQERRRFNMGMPVGQF